MPVAEVPTCVVACGEVLIIKGVHRAGSGGFVDLLIAPLDASIQLQTESVPFLGIEACQLEQMVKQAGAAVMQLLGNYQGEPYDRGRSVDLILVAEK